MKELRDCRRILVVGCSGAGKSTLARRLGRELSLPVVPLDRHFWQAGWVPLDRERWHEVVERLLEPAEWILDGGYHDTLARRLAVADAVVYLDLPRRVCLWRVLRRVVTGYGRTRPDLADGCPEKLDMVFLRWVWNWRRDVQPVVERTLSAAAGRALVITLRSPRDVARFGEELRDETAGAAASGG